MGKVLILTDGKAGHENQSRAFARALGCSFDLFEIHFKSRVAKVLSYAALRLSARSVPGFFDRWPTRMPEVVSGDAYDAVIGTGSGTFFAVATLAHELDVPSGVVLYPRGYPLARFGCVLAPSFDQPKQAVNVIALPANLVSGDAAFYEAGVASFRERHEPSMRPAVAVVVGGPNKCSTLTADWMRSELDRIFAENQGCEFWVTTSRRTPSDVERVVAERAWDYKLLYSTDHYNPIPAFVQLARRLYVTAESTGMLSEACTFGTAEVKALDNLKPGHHKFRRFVEDLRANGYVDGSRKVDLSDAFARAKALVLPGR